MAVILETFFAEALAYADDIILLDSTKYAVRSMLQICTGFSEEFDVIFNPAKVRECYLVYHHRAGVLFQSYLIIK